MIDTIVGLILALVVVPLVMLGVIVVSVNLLGIWGAPVGLFVLYLISKPFMSARWGGDGYDSRKGPNVYEPGEDAGGL